MAADGTWTSNYWPLHTPVKREVLVLNGEQKGQLEGIRVRKCAFWKYLLEMSKCCNIEINACKHTFSYFLLHFLFICNLTTFLIILAKSEKIGGLEPQYPDVPDGATELSTTTRTITSDETTVPLQQSSNCRDQKFWCTRADCRLRNVQSNCPKTCNIC